MDFTERMLERNRSRNKPETKESTSQTSAPLKEIHRNTVTTTSTTISSTTGGSNKVTIETKVVTMRKLPKVKSESNNEESTNEDETSTNEEELNILTTEEKENNADKKTSCPLRKDTKNRLQRLGVLYSDDPSRLSSPIHRTEDTFLTEPLVERQEDPQEEPVPFKRSVKNSIRSARFAKLADTINHWEDDVKHPPVGTRTGKKLPTTSSVLSKHMVHTSKKPEEHRKFISPQKWSPKKQLETETSSSSSDSPPYNETKVASKSWRALSPEKNVHSILKRPCDRRTPPYTQHTKPVKTQHVMWNTDVIKSLEEQGFSRSESSKRIIYDYKKNEPTSSRSPPKLTVRTPSPVKSGSPVKLISTIRSVSPDKITSTIRVVSPTKPDPSSHIRVVSPEKFTSTASVSPTKPHPVSHIRSTSPTKPRYTSPIQMGTSAFKSKEAVAPQSSDDDVTTPTMGVKQLRNITPHKATTPSTPSAGSVLDRAARYEEATSPTKREREPDPAELPLAARLALFERNAGAAPVPLPKVPFGMSVPTKTLQPNGARKVENRKLSPRKPTMTQQYPGSSGGSTSSSSLHDRLAALQRGSDNAEKGHMKNILTERQREMDMLKHRWDRYKGVTEPQPNNYEPSAPPPTPPPLPSPPQQFEYRRSSGFYQHQEDDCEMEEDDNYGEDKFEEEEVQQEKNQSKAYPGLAEVKKVRLSPPKPGRLYPCLSDIEAESEHRESEIEEYEENNRSSSSETSNESDLHSLGQDIVNLSRTNLKRDWSMSESGNEEQVIKEMDDFLEEALAESSDEPTPPKRTSYSHNIGTVQSRSFEYSSNEEQRNSSSHPLLHTVSFYRKQQTMSLKPTSPVKHVQFDQTDYSSDDSIERLEAELDRELKLVEEKRDMLLQEVIKQQTIISQASQALNLCCSTIEFTGSTEQLEAEKLLLLASKRKQAAQLEIQRLKVEQTVRPRNPSNKSLTERGSLTLSNITLPLKMDVIHQAAKDDQCYYLLCLVQTDERVYCTDIMCAPRNLRQHNKLTFPNSFTLDGLYSDFKVTLEVYTMTARSKEIIPHDVKYHINTNKKDASKLKLTPRKGKGDNRLMMPSVQSPGGPMAVRTSSFSMAGYVIFSLREIHRNQFSLNKNAYTSVLEGSMQLHIQSEMSMDVEYRGFLTMFEDVSGFGAWHRRWCLLKGDKLSYWKYPDDERKKIALDTIELTTCVTEEVDVVPRDVCARPNTFLLETSRPARSTDVDSLVLIRKGNKTTIRHLLSADTKEDRIQWCLYLNKALALMRAWGIASTTLHK